MLRNTCRSSFALVAISLCHAIVLAGADPARASCTSEATDAITKGFVSRLALYRSCPLKWLTQSDPAGCDLGFNTTKADMLSTRLSSAVTEACTAPNDGTLTCAAVAADEAADVPGATLVAPYPVTDAKQRACRKALMIASTKLAKTAANALGTCSVGALEGVPGLGPPGPACTDGLGTPQAAIAMEEQKLRTQVVKKCSGPDKTVGTADDLDPQDVLGFGATCPGSPHCEAPIPGLTELADCAVCIATSEVGQAMTGALALPLPAADDCIVSLGRAAARAGERILQARAQCERDVLRGQATPPCPDAATLIDIASLEASLTTAALPSCAALDPQADLGFEPTCPTIGACAATISDMDDLLECVRCVTAERTESLVAKLYPVSAEETDLARRNCREEIGDALARDTSSLGRRKLTVLRSCESTQACGQTAGPCPDSEAAPRIDVARANAAQDIEARCAGIDPQDLGFASICPSLFGCAGQETDTLGGLIDCLTCITDGVADDLNDGYFRGPATMDEGLSDGFESVALDPSWTVLNGAISTIGVSGGQLHLQIDTLSNWFDAMESVLVYRTVTGDFDVHSIVRAAKMSNPLQSPDGQYRLGGLLARDPASTPVDSNFVHVALGKGPIFFPAAAEDKSTDASSSTYTFHPILDAEGELRLTRTGSSFSMYYRPVGGIAWQLLATHVRADLPATLQVGMMAYDFNASPDLTVSFDEIVFE